MKGRDRGRMKRRDRGGIYIIERMSHARPGA